MNVRDIRLNEDIESANGKFTYQLFWPYADELNPNKDIIDVFVKYEDTEYVGSFVTVKELESWFERFRKNGDYCNGTYIPLNEKEILLKQIREDDIEKTIEDLIKKEEFDKFFEEADLP